MLSHIDNLSRVPQPDISNYFIQFTLVSLSGPRDPKSFKVALFKGTMNINTRSAANRLHQAALCH